MLATSSSFNFHLQTKRVFMCLGCRFKLRQFAALKKSL